MFLLFINSPLQNIKYNSPIIFIFKDYVKYSYIKIKTALKVNKITLNTVLIKLNYKL
ncbi:hypothetical protein UT300010_15730 [Clostridium perfringens]|nr:hypothetical protein CPBEC2_04780 [Clostridium perfringens]BDA30910.1 hypothetical protein CPBEC4_10100 [Clostridium perfringens]BDC02929.1 hypothetical protein CP118TE_26380 [Clostridium perfringens E]